MPDLSELKKRYEAAMHGVQSGIAMMMNHDGGTLTGETSPKHLRVGVASNMVTESAVAKLLFRKGIATQEEYFEALCEAAEEERAMYEKTISDLLGGVKVNLR